MRNPLEKLFPNKTKPSALTGNAMREAASPTPKPLAVGESAPVMGADDLRGFDPAESERRIGQLTLQIHTLVGQRAAMEARARQVMIMHGAEVDDASKVYNLDTKAMTLTRVK